MSARGWRDRYPAKEQNQGGVMKPTAGKLAVAAAAMLALVAVAPPARAALDPIELVTNAVSNVVDSIRNGVLALFGRAPAEAVTPPTPSDVLRQVESGGAHSQFWGYLRDAGYDLASIDTSVGIIPEIKITFQLVRELSEADRDWLQQELEADALRRKGLVAKLQRRIVQSLLDASEFQDMRIAKLVIGILPLPSADFEVEPTNAPLSEDHDTIYRAILSKSGRRTGAKSNASDESP
jgi:hypothetical protein